MQLLGVVAGRSSDAVEPSAVQPADARHALHEPAQIGLLTHRVGLEADRDGGRLLGAAQP